MSKYCPTGSRKDGKGECTSLIKRTTPATKTSTTSSERTTTSTITIATTTSILTKSPTASPPPNPSTTSATSKPPSPQVVITAIGGYPHDIIFDVCTPLPSTTNQCSIACFTNTNWNSNPDTEQGVALMFDHICTEIGSNWYTRQQDVSKGLDFASDNLSVTIATNLQVTWATLATQKTVLVLKYVGTTYTYTVDNGKVMVPVVEGKQGAGGQFYAKNWSYARNDTSLVSLNDGIYDVFKLPFMC